MNGPEHYAAAEKLLAGISGKDRMADIERRELAAAQVHATLAHAAATALDPSSWPDSAGHRAWVEVAF